MTKFKTSVSKLWITLWNKSKPKSKTIEMRDTRKPSIKLITWKDKEDKDFNKKWKPWFHRRKMKRRFWKVLKGTPRLITKNKHCLSKRFQKWWLTLNLKLKKNRRKSKKNTIKKWVNSSKDLAITTNKRLLPEPKPSLKKTKKRKKQMKKEWEKLKANQQMLFGVSRELRESLTQKFKPSQKPRLWVLVRRLQEILCHQQTNPKKHGAENQ